MDPADSLSSNPPVSPKQIQTPSPPSPTSPSKVLLALTGLGLFILGGIGGVLAQKFILSSKTTVRSEPPINSISPSPTPNPTANWKTCSDSVRRFTMRYPPSFELDTGSCNYAIADYSIVKDINVASPTQDLQKNWLIGIASENSTLDINQWIKNKRCLDNSRCSATRPGPIPSSLEFDLLNVHYAESDVVSKANGIIFDFSLNARNPSTPANEEVRGVFHQILSTFKLLGQDVSYECGVCGPQGNHNLEGKTCAPGLECKNSDVGIVSSVSFCVKPGESIKKCL